METPFTMDSTLTELIASLKHTHANQIDTLHRFCAINSGSHHLQGLATMAETLVQAFAPIADSIETHAFDPIETIAMSGEPVLQPVGSALLIRKRPDCKQRVLLCGHMDTVYGIDNPFQTSRLQNDNTLNGPGVADMKGGLIVMLHALTAFEQLASSQDLGWDVLINADEEIGSPASSSLIDTLAPHYHTALVYEPAMDADGCFAKNRRGSGKFTLVATGKSAHVGRAFQEGCNAIAYLAESVVAIHALNFQRKGVTINVGKIAGGEALNMVPAKAVAKLDIRVASPADVNWVHKQLNAIIERLQRKEFTLTLHGHFGRPIKKVTGATTQLFQRIQYLGQLLGLTLTWRDSGGCCDGNNLAKHQLPVIDTLGVRGGQIHSPQEYILLDSLTERTALSLLILADLANRS